MTLFYAIQFTLIVILGLAIYYYGLRELKMYYVSRVLLLFLVPAAALLPLLYNIVFYEISPTAFGVVVDEILIGNSPGSEQSISPAKASNFNFWLVGLAGVYATGMLYSAAVIIKSFFKLQRMKRDSVLFRKLGSAEIYQWSGDLPFTFMNDIFLPAGLEEDDPKYKMVLRHEMYHVVSRHWMDKFWVNFQCILLWFFPPVYSIRSAVDELHELQADRAVTKDFSKKAYMLLLFQSALKTNTIGKPLTSPFISLTLKKRIKMISGKTKSAGLSVLITFLCFTAIGAVSLTGCKKMGIEDSTENRTALKSEEQVFQVVEEMPRFPGCEDREIPAEERLNCSQRKMLEFVYENIQYPKAAKEKGLEGMVVISFVVNKKGRIQDANIARNLGEGLGEEALRVVELMNEMEEKWIPGRQKGELVNVQYNLPVRFTLLDDDEE